MRKKIFFHSFSHITHSTKLKRCKFITRIVVVCTGMYKKIDNMQWYTGKANEFSLFKLSFPKSSSTHCFSCVVSSIRSFSNKFLFFFSLFFFFIIIISEKLLWTRGDEFLHCYNQLLTMFIDFLWIIIKIKLFTWNWGENVLKTPSNKTPDCVCTCTMFPTCEVAACIKSELL